MTRAFVLAVPFVVAVGLPACDLLSSAECNVDADCHGSHVCVAQQCVECRTDRDCDTDETCSGGTCERGAPGGGEGEGAPGGGEGEGTHGGGEGEGTHGGGEGEGSFGGEGEGSFGGEGEGESNAAALAFSLTWDNTDADVDLHATKGTPFCLDDGTVTTLSTPPTYGPISQVCAGGAPADCDWIDCRSGNSTVDWDGSGGAGTAGDPLLEADWISVSASCGGTNCSPLELTDVRAPVAGSYLVEAVYYGNEGATANPPPVTTANVTLTVSFQGSTVKTVHASLAAPGSTSDLAVVHVNAAGDVTCVGDVSDGVDECP